MTGNDLKVRVRQWAEKIGHKEAMKRLVNADISVAVIQKLFNGSYVSTLSMDKAQAIAAVLEKDDGAAAS